MARKIYLYIYQLLFLEGGGSNIELKYNKVYTVSQLIDRYVAERRPWNTTGIKNEFLICRLFKTK